MATISQALDAAVKHHQAGNLDEAERLYGEILKHDPRHPDAWHLLGLVAYGRGEFEKALEQIRLAIEIDPEQAPFHNHLAEAYRALSRLPEAEASCRQALALRPDFAIAHNVLGTVLVDVDQAMASFRQAIALKPDFAQAHLNLGLGLQSRGQVDEAIASYRRAITFKPDYALALRQLGTLLQTESRFDEAIECHRKVLALNPNDAETLCNLGSALKDLNRTAEAIENYQRALSIQPNLAEANYNLGVVLQGQGRLAEAAELYRAAIRAKPDHAEAYSNLGTACKSLGQLSDAMHCYDAALRCRDDLAEAHRNRALLWLMLGDFAAGWQEYEWRWRVPGTTRHRFAQPRWNGELLAGGAILLVAEQGLGDTIQFIRYAPLVKERSQADVLLQCPPALFEFLKGAAGIDRFVEPGASDAPFDRYLPMLSLPGMFDTRLDSVPADVPYLSADPELVKYWQGELARFDGFKVGIAWQGNPAYAADAQRSVPLGEFAVLADCPGVRLFSLQKRHGCEQLAPLGERLGIVDLGPLMDEAGNAFVDTAAVMKCLDLVITSDTAIAHLAGALGVRVWVVLHSVADWRWLLEREDSPWYPSMRLFRQSQAGDWAELFARVAAELRSLSASTTNATCQSHSAEGVRESAETHFKAGSESQEQGQLDAAIESYRRAVEIDPKYVIALSNLGVALRKQGRMDEAIATFEQAIKLQPLLPQLHYNLANAYSKQRRLDQAEAGFRRAIALAGEYFEPCNNLGSLLQAQGRLSEAKEMFDAALKYKPNAFEAHCNRSFLRLLQGEFAEGWPEYEWRLQLPDSKRPSLAQPRWEGQSAARGTIVLWAEQGLGDAIQFVRYAKLVQQRSKARVLVRCAPGLRQLLRTAPGVARCVGDEVDSEPFDYQAALMSLPAVLGTTLDTIPTDVPYLFAEPDRIEHWRRELAKFDGLKVGIAWQGSPTYSQDAHRSIPLAEFAPLAACAGVQLISLQKGHGREQLSPLVERFGIVDLGATLDEGTGAFIDTAAVMENLDLVVTSDTAVAHLAGALGVRVWVALASTPDWRWMLNRDDSPWYPSMRLFRQARLDEWGEVFARIAQALRSLSSERPVS